MNRPKIFISYSHKDERWKDRLLRQLRVLQLEGHLDVWTDRDIEPGEEWLPKIAAVMDETDVAILLISANSLTSDFILHKEVPSLLQRREEEGMRVYPIIVEPCPYQYVDWLAKMQVRPKDGKPLSGSRKSQVDKTLSEIAVEVLQLGLNRT